MSIGRFRAIGPVVRSRIRTAKGAKEERLKVEVLVDLTGQNSPFTLADIIPAGAANVLVSGRVVEEITIVGLGDPATDIGLVEGAVLVSTDYFGSVDGSVDDTFTPADMDDGLSSGVGVPIVFTESADIKFTAGANFLTGSVRLAIFYTLVSAPRR